LHYNYFKSLALGIKLNALFTDDKTLSTHLLVDELYANIKRLNFHWKFWPQILGEYMKMTFDEEEAKKKYVFNPENLKDNNDQNDDNSLKISKNTNIFQDKNDDLISLTLPSCFSERKFTLKHYNNSDSNNSSNGYSKPSWLKDNSLDFSDLHQHYNKKGKS
jgi:hypothetical protein